MNSCVTDGCEVRDEAQSSRSNLCGLCFNFARTACNMDLVNSLCTLRPITCLTIQEEEID